MDYEKDMRIDELALDSEWLDQPVLALKYGKAYAKAIKNLENQREKVKTIRSELIKEAHTDPEKTCNQKKITAPQVEAYYRTHSDYTEAKEEEIELEYEKNMLEIAKNEISYSRKSALENLVSLLGQQYFAGPKVPRNIKQEADKKRKERQEKTATGTKIRRKKNG